MATTGTGDALTHEWVVWTTAATSTTNVVWNNWIDTTTFASTTPQAIWYTWSNNVVSNNTITVGGGMAYERTPEQQAEDAARWERERVENQRRADESAAKRRLACERAKQLLESMLDHKQREQLQKDRFFEVIARASKRRYRIRYGTHGNVRLLDDAGREVMSYCGQPVNVPTEDAMLAQKLQLEYDEETYLKAANASRVA